MAFLIPAQHRSFLPRFYRLAVVGILSNMMIPLASLVDSAFLGHLENINYLAGVILGGILFDYLYRILKFLRNSTNSLTANAVGKDDQAAMLVVILRCGLMALAIAAVMLLFQYPIHRFGFALLSGSPEMELAGLDYFNARIWGAPAVLLNFVVIGWFLGRELNWIVLLMSFVGNGSNVLFDYLMIVQWGWESTGAGLATAISQYLALFIGLVAIAFTTKWQFFKTAWSQIFKGNDLSRTLALKGNMLIRYFSWISSYAIFTNLSASFGTELLAENGLLLQIALLSQFTVQGVGMTSQTLIGNFHGQKQTDKIMSVLKVALLTGLAIALGFALVTVFFPHIIFKILTNHANVTQMMQRSAIWLIPLLSLNAIAFMLESYFSGIKDGVTLRNGALLGFVCGFLPLTYFANYYQSENLLWAALTGHMATVCIYLTFRLLRIHQSPVLVLSPGDRKANKVRISA
ncbi:guanitoxin biosynthesis MATE family efflux transporter GntT [[Limnothrix rosea] IAM M-220]|uniref:guanitoxin biosynthesis MATE family efflux transporter GntT n=1 Tax=[Limnothrix rosea] IAM M-220 TaxID=454133 RepID=UPI0009602B12|nr:guanitoxin biosynthesis MATE family efflux transporter GntT [[Limnothrix rosea] IAM M-220]OKH18732.1 MATE family efflux transporter [[Limnothrix rosea] IAM M-220]